MLFCLLNSGEYNIVIDIFQTIMTIRTVQMHSPGPSLKRNPPADIKFCVLAEQRSKIYSGSHLRHQWLTGDHISQR